jgi:hypothetical protein
MPRSLTGACRREAFYRGENRALSRKAEADAPVGKRRSVEPESNLADDGPRLSDRVRERLFEALAETKAIGMGIGPPSTKSNVDTRFGHICVGTRVEGAGRVFGFASPSSAAESDR